MIYNIKFDRFSFNDKKYINYFIDYEELKENNSKVVKLFSNVNSNLKKNTPDFSNSLFPCKLEEEVNKKLSL